MFRTLLGGKIHRATVTRADLNYVGSITVDLDLLDAAGICVNEKVQIVNNNNLHHCRRARQRRNLPQRRGGAAGAAGRRGNHHVVRFALRAGNRRTPAESGAGGRAKQNPRRDRLRAGQYRFVNIKGYLKARPWQCRAWILCSQSGRFNSAKIPNPVSGSLLPRLQAT